jgi:hypothetical protein
MKTTLIAFLIIGALGSICAMAQGTTGTSTTTTTTNYFFPPVGLSSGETISVSLVNIAPASTSSTGTAPSCTGTVTFAGIVGSATSTTVLNTGGKPTSFTVGSGQIATVSVPFATSGLTSTRGEVLASVQQTVTRPATAPCSLVFSLEVYDSAGDQVFLGNSAASTQIPSVLADVPR